MKLFLETGEEEAISCLLPFFYYLLKEHIRSLIVATIIFAQHQFPVLPCGKDLVSLSRDYARNTP